MLPLSDVSNKLHTEGEEQKRSQSCSFIVEQNFRFFLFHGNPHPMELLPSIIEFMHVKNMTQVKTFFRLTKNGQNARSMNSGQFWVSHSTIRTQFDRQNPTSRIASSRLEPKPNGVLDFGRTSSWTFYVILGISADLSPNRTQFRRSKSTDHTV